MVNLLRIFSVILTVFATGEALICYNCRFCDDIFESNNVVEKDCSNMFEYPTCEKLVYELNNLTRGVIARRCQFTVYLTNTSYPTPYSAENQKYQGDYLHQYYVAMATRRNDTRPFVRRISVFHCQSDYCNNTSSMSTSLTIILTTIILIML